MRGWARLLGAGVWLWAAAMGGAGADEPPLADYFRAETARIAARPLAGIDSADEWKARRPELQRQLKEMLGLWPEPERVDLQPRVTGTIERPEFVVEKLLFRSAPGLDVTANLYRPREADGRRPAILYVCGHAKEEKDGVIFGNKAHYQHHAEWYAANGYVCLVLDTLQLGELPGLHHGTHREGMWWWQSRGYTPAGVEAWNAIRAIDYLLTRPDVDPARLGATGRSGGGATSWWVGALDDRVAAVVPVAGITDLQDHVVDGVIAGHCDCMYPVNTYRWDFPLIAALVAPKPLLVENTDKDPIFPEDGVRRVYAVLEQVYAWYGASDRLGLVIGSGGHIDSPEIRHPSFAFFEAHLKGVGGAEIVEPDRKIPVPELKVLEPGAIPAGNRNASIHETFVPRAVPPAVPETADAWEMMRALWMEELRKKVFAGWPGDEEAGPLDPERAAEVVRDGLVIRAVDYTSQPGVRLRMWVLSDPEGTDRAPAGRTVVVAGEEDWKALWSWLPGAEEDRPAGPPEGLRERAGWTGGTLVVVAPRGVGPTAWEEGKTDTHIRRRFALLGQTLAGMQVWDVRRALAALGEVGPADTRADRAGAPRIRARGAMAPVALWAAVFEPRIEEIRLDHPPETVREGPAFLNLERVMGMPQALALLFPRRVVLSGTAPGSWAWARDLAANLGRASWPEFAPPDEG